MSKSPIDLDALLKSDSKGSDVRVHGLRVGDAALKLESLEFIGVKPGFGGKMVFEGGSMIWTPVDGTPVHLSDADVRRMLLAEGMPGRLRLEHAMFQVRDGRIEKIFLSSLPEFAQLRSVERVHDVLGRSEGIERHYGTTLHYPSRDLVVHMHEGIAGAPTVVLGPDSWTPPRFGARELLHAYLELAPVLAPNGQPVEEAALDLSWDVRRIQFERLRAMMRAFGIESLRAMAHGAWLANADTSRCADALGRLIAQIPDADPERPHVAVDRAYIELLSYRARVERLLRHNEGFLECSLPVLAGALVLTESINEQLKTLIEPIDDILCSLVDPEGRTFSLEELVALGYPDVDLATLRYR